MVNAWSLLIQKLNGTMDEDYPIMSENEDDVTILGGGNLLILLLSQVMVLVQQIPYINDLVGILLYLFLPIWIMGEDHILLVGNA